MKFAAFPGIALLVARVTMGLFFLYEATGQIAKGWLGGDGLEHMLQSALDDNAIPAPYRAFLENVVLPHTDLGPRSSSPANLPSASPSFSASRRASPPSPPSS